MTALTGLRLHEIALFHLAAGINRATPTRRGFPARSMSWKHR
jgi:hypothetical protein